MQVRNLYSAKVSEENQGTPCWLLRGRNDWK